MIDEQPLSQQDILAINIAAVRARIDAAAQRVGRRAEEVTLIAVSKTKPLELVRMAYEIGVTDFGENRVQEALTKISSFSPSNLSWHMIGHVQSNKANKVVGKFSYVHSVDSLHLAQALQRQAEKMNVQQGILLQVNVSGEASKEGMTPEETLLLARQIAKLPALKIGGLMTVAPLVNDAEEVRPIFRTLRLLRDRLQQEIPDCSWQHLSMGMTDDYCIAVEEGATLVRVGRAIFGERVKKEPDNEVR